jgi:S1-C subfamily serine protease
VLPGGVLVCPALVIVPFLPRESRSNLVAASHTTLLPGTSIHCVLGDSSDKVPLRLAALRPLLGVLSALRTLTSVASTAGAGGWRVGWPSQQSAFSQSQEDALYVSSHAAVFEVEGATTTVGPRDAVWWAIAPSRSIRIGSRVTSKGFPFAAVAPGVLSGFLSEGIVSLVVPRAPSDRADVVEDAADGRQAALFLCDMRCLPGSEGSTVVLAAPSRDEGRRAVVGILWLPLRAEAAQAEVPAVVPIWTIVEALALAGERGASAARPWMVAMGTNRAVLPLDIARCVPDGGLLPRLPTVVGVECLGRWGSGVAVGGSGRIIVTNAHVLAGVTAAAGGAHRPMLVTVRGPDGKMMPAEVLHINTGPLDLAVLSVDHSRHSRHSSISISIGGGSGIEGGWQGARPAIKPPVPGQRIIVLGYPVWNPSAGLGPIASSGNIGKVVCIPCLPDLNSLTSQNSLVGGTTHARGDDPSRGGGGPDSSDSTSGTPAMLVSTAPVVAGSSGGAVLDAASGELLGIITSNARLSGRRPALVPCLSFSVPADPWLSSVFALADILAPEKDRWRSVDARSEELASVWALGGGEEGRRPPDGPRAPKALQELLRQMEDDGPLAGRRRAKL